MLLMEGLMRPFTRARPPAFASGPGSTRLALLGSPSRLASRPGGDDPSRGIARRAERAKLS